jgi:hypothetical protein
VSAETDADLAKKLGRHFVPLTPISWTWHKGSSPLGPVHLLVMETTIGQLGFALAENDMAAFVRSAQEQLTGLTLPTSPLVGP